MADGFDKKIATTITVYAEGHGMSCGDIIHVTKPEDRWWVRFIFWIMFLPRPFREIAYNVSNVDSDSTMVIKERYNYFL